METTQTMGFSDQDIKELLDFDPVAEIEKEKGAPFGIEDLGSFIAANQVKKAVLKATNDTNWDTTIPELIEILEANGFEQILKKEFQYQETQHWSELGGKVEVTRTSWLYVFWDKARGILVDFDTYARYGIEDGKLVKQYDKINGGTMRYNICPKTSADLFKGTSSGGFYKPENLSWDEFSALPANEKVWVGDHDIREGFLHKLRILEQHYDFLPEWVSAPFMWLLHYCEESDRYGYDHGFNSRDELIEARIKELPEEVQKSTNYGVR